MREKKWNFYVSGMQAHPSRCNSADAIDGVNYVKSFMSPETHPKLLNIGVGEGMESYLFKKMGYDVTGIIWGEPNVKYAMEHYKDIRFVNCDMHDLPFPSNSFDAAYMNEVFEHAYAPYIFLLELYCVLKEGGICYIHGPHYDDRLTPNNPSTIEAQWISHHHPSILPKNVYKQLFEKTGFELIHGDDNGSVFVIKKLSSDHLHQDVSNLLAGRDKI